MPSAEKRTIDLVLPDLRHGRSARAGGALVLALIVVAFVTAFSVAMLRVGGSVSQRQANATNDKRAFYLAEAGLSEAYLGLQSGKNGQIGSLEAPALLGDGLVWVDATWGADGLVTLRSTGLCESGRSTLELVVRRETQAFGIFADEGIDLAVPFLLDGYDSETTTYYQQAGLQTLVLPQGDTDYKFELWDGAGGGPGGLWLHYGSYYYACMDWDFSSGTFHWAAISKSAGDTRKYLDTGEVAGTVILATEWDGGQASPDSDAAVLAVAPNGSQSSGIPDPSVTPSTYDDFTTGSGGELGSNGPISLATIGTDPIVVHGSLVPGPNSQVTTGEGVGVSGSTAPRAETLVLPPASAPDLALLPGVTHSSAIPYVLPPGQVGYEHVRVAPGSELVLQGPSELVIGELLLEQDAILVVENETGAVNLYVTGFVDFDPGSVVQVASQDTTDLSLQGTDTALEFTLDARSQFHGMVYAPDSHVYVGSAFEIFGMLASNTLDVAPYARLHFDSGVLSDSGAVPLPKLVGWSIQEIPAAVAQSRVDPFELLGLDREELEQAADCQETVSWTYEYTYWDQAWKKQTFNGPYEQFDPSDARMPVGQAGTYTPPEATLSAPWRIQIEFFDWNDALYSFDGTMDEFAANYREKCITVLSRTMTPPPELQ